MQKQTFGVFASYYLLFIIINLFTPNFTLTQVKSLCFGGVTNFFINRKSGVSAATELIF